MSLSKITPSNSLQHIIIYPLSTTRVRTPRKKNYIMIDPLFGLLRRSGREQSIIKESLEGKNEGLYIPKEGEKVMEENSILKTLAAKVDRRAVKLFIGAVFVIVMMVLVLALVVVTKYGHIKVKGGVDIELDTPTEEIEDREKPD